MEEVVKNTNRVQEGKKCFCAPPLVCFKRAWSATELWGLLLIG